MPATLACPNCARELPSAPAELAALPACGHCGQKLAVTAFPALLRPAAPAPPAEKLILEGEASCFYHAARRAVVPCGACGRFLCTLCEVNLGGRSLCPGCLESGRNKNQFTELEPGRTLWDTGAFILALLPLLLCWPGTLLSAPATLVVAWIGWKKPSSVIARGPWRLWVAVILATLQIAAWVVVFVLLAKGYFKS